MLMILNLLTNVSLPFLLSIYASSIPEDRKISYDPGHIAGIAIRSFRSFCRMIYVIPFQDVSGSI